jgi:hypothetical protein
MVGLNGASDHFVDASEMVSKTKKAPLRARSGFGLVAQLSNRLNLPSFIACRFPLGPQPERCRFASLLGAWLPKCSCARVRPVSFLILFPVAIMFVLSFLLLIYRVEFLKNP